MSRATESGATPAFRNARGWAVMRVDGSLSDRPTSSATLYVMASRMISPSAPALPRTPPLVAPRERPALSVNCRNSGSNVRNPLRRWYSRSPGSRRATSAASAGTADLSELVSGGASFGLAVSDGAGVVGAGVAGAEVAAELLPGGLLGAAVAGCGCAAAIG